VVDSLQNESDGIEDISGHGKLSVFSCCMQSSCYPLVSLTPSLLALELHGPMAEAIAKEEVISFRTDSSHLFCACNNADWAKPPARDVVASWGQVQKEEIRV